MTRRDRDVRLGYAGLAVGACAFVGALVVTTTVVDVLPDLIPERPVAAAEQRVVGGEQVRPLRGGTRGAPAGGGGSVSPAPVPASSEVPGSRGTAPSPTGPQSPQGPSAPPDPQSPQSPQSPQGPTPSAPPPAPPEGGGDGPVSSLLGPVATGAAQTLDELSGGATRPVGQELVGVVGTLGETADGPLSAGTPRR